jgi:hypothetical protein
MRLGAGGVFDRTHQRIRGRGGWDFFDDDSRLVFDFDFRADFDLAGAILVLARIHQPAGLKIGQALERLFLEDGDLGFEQGERVRRIGRIAMRRSGALRPGDDGREHAWNRWHGAAAAYSRRSAEHEGVGDDGGQHS